ncbi:conserved phage C-terminal domain-containing protein [Bacillus pumilus]|uniref:conserved phage C-terminal domain-containing protein n=1 Tax=Bacillus pumilus TaxID=1408 RepID=UPI0008202329|nr:conserved phage C-terminal domain-containing protein [Bacillus pumilus]MBR0587108.1 DNA replication protein DnaD [Bacillus pumilus DW2J2]AOC55412.1 DNA replication protein DnaD [Bacillus pumilus]MBR0618506.1 DNA replication protein DnaD [Bacillus pumilus]MBR0624853.1 DNA replication protein DnaD [Bacillus pumilus]MCY7744768.1 conserved phage C-terminal domain-containing protein [Bacillus pumilus]
MAKFRHVQTTFWQDPKVTEEMTPEDRYFFLYLITNPNTTQIGIYSITKKQMAFDLGYSIESVNSLMDRFINHHKLVLYNNDTREVAIKNWPKYNLNKGGKPILDCVTKELREVKDKSLMSVLYPKIENTNIRVLFERYANDTLHDTSTTSGQKEKEKEKEKEKKDILSGNPTADESEIPFKLITDLLNQMSEKNYRHTTPKTQQLIKARWNEGFRFDDFKKVILAKCYEWRDNPDMSKFLRPETLFGTKFEGYLNNSDEVIKRAQHKGGGSRSHNRQNDLPF